MPKASAGFGTVELTTKARLRISFKARHAILDDGTITIQIHTVSLTRDDTTVMKDVPVLAVWVPARMAREWIDRHHLPQAQ